VRGRAFPLADSIVDMCGAPLLLFLLLLVPHHEIPAGCLRLPPHERARPSLRCRLALAAENRPVYAGAVNATTSSSDKASRRTAAGLDGSLRTVGSLLHLLGCHQRTERICWRSRGRAAGCSPSLLGHIMAAGVFLHDLQTRRARIACSTLGTSVWLHLTTGCVRSPA
jgi:hypothetical protein